MCSLHFHGKVHTHTQKLNEFFSSGLRNGTLPAPQRTPLLMPKEEKNLIMKEGSGCHISTWLLRIYIHHGASRRLRTEQGSV